MFRLQDFSKYRLGHGSGPSLSSALALVLAGFVMQQNLKKTEELQRRPKSPYYAVSQLLQRRHSSPSKGPLHLHLRKNSIILKLD